MDSFFIILIVVLLLALVYVLFNYKLMKVIDAKFKDIYKSKIQSDIQEFYREMESYSALLENRVNRFKKLQDRQEENLARWQQISDDIKKSRKGKQIDAYLEKSLAKEQQLLKAIGNLQYNSEALLQKFQPKPNLKTQKLAISVRAASQGKSPTNDDVPPGKGPGTIRGGPPLAEPVSVSKQAVEMANEHLTVAEELVMSMPHEAGLSDQRENRKSPQAKPQVLETPRSRITLMTVLAKIGETLSPLLRRYSSTHKTDLPAETNDYDGTAPGKKHDFARLLTENNQEKSRSRGLISNRPDEMTSGRTLGSGPTANKSNTTTKSQLRTTLTQEELNMVVADLHDSGKRPMALKILMLQGFGVNKIADLSKIPYSDLEATRSIYGL